MVRLETGRFEPWSLEAQADFVAAHGLDTLLFCPDSWALRHRFIDTGSGLVVRSRCGSWSCLYCGPRKVDMWRQLVKAAEPTLFITLTKVGTTLKEAARTLTTVLQYLRRGSKGRGKEHIGARPAYPIQMFAVLEEHSDFAENGFHWHLLVKGVDFIPNQVVSDALRSATGGRSYITKVKRVKNNTAVGYVTKYLTKEIMRERRGLVEEEKTVTRVAVEPVKADQNGRPYAFVTRYDEQGQVVMEEERKTVERLCKAHRIRYSKGFFPESTAVLRQRLFGEKQLEQAGEKREAELSGLSGEEATQEQEQPRPVWILYEVEPLAIEDADGQRNGHTLLLRRKLKAEEEGGEIGIEVEEEASEELEPDLEEAGPERERALRVQRYQRMHREALLESLQALRDGQLLYSRRIIGIWNYQREQLRLAG